MIFLSTILPALLALVFSSPAAAESQRLVKNYCDETTWAFFDWGGSEEDSGPWEIPTGQAFLSPIRGEGDVAIITKTSNTFGPDVGQMRLGTTLKDGIVYWYVENP